MSPYLSSIRIRDQEPCFRARVPLPETCANEPLENAVTRAIVVDIEGTTSSIRFVHDVLFPYSRKHLPAFIVTHEDRPEVQHWLHEAAREAGLVSVEHQEIIELLVGWIDADRKSTALKALQGMIWEEGYRGGLFRAHVYQDAVTKMREWHGLGISLYVYSSGSVAAQELFFEHSEFGDLSALFSGNFDTEIGPKRDPESYRRIAAEIDVPPEEILFLSDVIEELDAARTAGFRTTLVARSPMQCEAGAAHPCVEDFSRVAID